MGHPWCADVHLPLAQSLAPTPAVMLPLNTQMPFLTKSGPWQDLLVPWVGEEHLLWASTLVPTTVPSCGGIPTCLYVCHQSA